MSDRTPAELMEGPSPTVLALTGALLVTGAVGALVLLPGERAALLSGIAGLGLLGLLTGWLFARKGYSFAEGWFAGVVFFPLALAFGLWGPPRAGAGG